MDIRIENLGYTYHPRSPFEQRVLEGIHLHIPAGTWLAIAGKTGSGKSTLVQHINGLLQPTEGTVQVGDVVMSSSSKKQRILYERVGMVFQNPEHQLFEETVEKDIAYGPKNMGWSENDVQERVKEAITQVGLDDSFFERSPFALSGGEKRRVAIAGVLAMQPRILVLDEPTVGLDPHGKKMMLDMIRDWQKKDKRTVILVTHQMDDVAEYADQVLILESGKVKWQTDPLTLFSMYHAECQLLGLDIPQALKLLTKLNEKLDTPITVESPRKEVILQTIAKYFADNSLTK